VDVFLHWNELKSPHSLPYSVVSERREIHCLKGLDHAILSNFVHFAKLADRVFHLQNHGHITTENDFPAV